MKARDIETDLKPIQELFFDVQDGHPFFVVPAYQREYSWTAKEKCDVLWQDIEDCVKATLNKSHFLGSIIVDKSDTKESGLVDGQQRVTTFMLLLKALLLRLNERIEELGNFSDKDSKNLLKKLEKRRATVLLCLFEVDEDGAEEIADGTKALEKSKIKYKNISMNESHKEEVESILLGDSFDEIERVVHKSKGKKLDNKYTNYFRNFKFFYDQFVIREVWSQLNEYAKGILEKCQIVIITSHNTEQAIEIFNSLNSKGQPLTDANIISAQLYQNTNTQKGQKEFKKEWETIVEVGQERISEYLNQYMYIIRAKERLDSTTLPSVRNFFTNIKKSLMNDSKTFVSDINKIIKAWNPAEQAIKYLQTLLGQFNSNFALFYIPYLYIKDNDTLELKVEYINALLKLFVLLEAGEKGYSSAQFKAKLFKINASLPSTNTREIIDDINAHIAKEFDRTATHNYLTENAVKNGVIFLNEVLFAIGKEQPVDFGINLDFILSDRINMEHIMPSSGKNKDEIRKDASIASLEEFTAFANLIGNKILLEENINKSISNAWFRTKRQNTVMSKKGYKNSIFPIATSLVNYSKDIWTQADIKQATIKAAERIVAYIFDPNAIIGKKTP